jgi:hypothetical protein
MAINKINTGTPNFPESFPIIIEKYKRREMIRIKCSEEKFIGISIRYVIVGKYILKTQKITIVYKLFLFF